jgi:hypothetical protein
MACGCDWEPAHHGVLGRADIPDIDPPSILVLLDSQPLRPHGDVESTISRIQRSLRLRCMPTMIST